MKIVIAILIVVGLLFGAWKTWEYWDKVSKQKETEAEAEAAVLDSSQLPGMPYQLESSLQAARQQGAKGLRKWLDAYRYLVKDPRLAAIELEYVVVLSREDPAEARRVFAKVKERVPPNSPLQPRIKALEKNYE